MGSPYAHTPGTSQGLWHKLDEHLEQVAQNLIPTLTKLGQPELARPLGLLHDAGKCLPDFQQYLQDVFAGRVKPPGPPHAPYGALLTGHFGHRNAGLINVLRGHHAGLMDAGDLSTFYRKERDERAIEAVLHYLQAAFPDLQRTQANPALTDRLTTELQTRMLLSALADADYLDTARHRRPDLERRRAEMRRDLTGYRDTYWGVVSNLQKDVSLSPINLIRREILEHAQAAALGPTGIYQLTTPTGGGKTRASLAFALDHAFHRGLERIIVAAPFNSITTQTARNYRALLKGLPVLEHHSSLPPERLPYTARLAAENWDAPVIVTSFVQLLESLHSAHPARVRKLHNLARSVIVLDEVQAVPVAFIGPVVRMLEQLTQNYGATVLLCTATPPAVQGATPFLEGFAHVTPVVPLGRQQSHFTALKRVTFTRTEAPLPWTTLADQIADEPQSLTILNTRRDALALLDVLQGATPNPVRHLSTLQCGAHRADVLTEVESRLTATPSLPIHLVSTQVIEAGVDIDFPFVARALGPLPSIIQAAGRCNREFRLGKGRVLIFEPLDGSPLPGGEDRDLIGLTRALLTQPDLLDHLDEPGISEMFYTRAYRRLQTDQHGILREREAQNFATVERLFKLIEDDTIPVHVHYGKGAELLAELPEEPTIEDLRRLSPYAVGVSQRFVDRHLGDLLREIRPGLLVWHGEYDKVAGLRAALVLR